MNSVWTKTLRRLRRRVPGQSFETWIRSMQYDGYRKGVLRLLVSDEYHKNWVMDNYLSAIRVAASQVCRRDVDVLVDLSDTCSAPQKKSPGRQLKLQSPPQKPKKSPLVNCSADERFTFANYVLGDSNEFALAASQKVVGNLAKEFNPLFIHGHSGVGKTHLLFAIANYVRKQHPDLTVLYRTAEQFTNELMDSLASKQMASFRARYRSLDVFLIDDIQFIQAKNKTQETFLHTFDAIFDLGCQIVISCDRLPEELPLIDEKLVSRFASGLVVGLTQPDLKLKTDILRKRAADSGAALPDNVAYYIAGRSCGSVRQLLGMLTKVLAFSDWKHSPLTPSLAKTALRDYGAQDAPGVLSIETIQVKVASYYGLMRSHLLSKERARTVVTARQVAMFLCRELLNESYPTIGKKFAGMCHAAVIYACKAVQKKMKKDTLLNRIVDTLRTELNSELIRSTEQATEHRGLDDSQQVNARNH